MNLLGVRGTAKYSGNEFDPRVYGDEQFSGRMPDIYESYARVLFDCFKPLSCVDVGCANGFVPEYLLRQGVDAFGIEGAEAAFRHMPEGIRQRVYRLDLRADWTQFFFEEIRRKFEVVNFTEVAEHLRVEHEEVMLRNVRMLTGKFLILSWSDEWCPYRGTERQEHFNPRPKKYVKKRLEGMGFSWSEALTREFNDRIRRLDVYEHWKDNIMVFSV